MMLPSGAIFTYLMRRIRPYVDASRQTCGRTGVLAELMSRKHYTLCGTLFPDHFAPCEGMPGLHWRLAHASALAPVLVTWLTGPS